MLSTVLTSGSSTDGARSLRQLLTGFAIIACLAGTAHAQSPDEDNVKVAHAVFGSVSWAFVLPIGALVIRLAPSTTAWAWHASIQAVGLSMVIVGAGTGIYCAVDTQQLNNPHPIIGLVLFGLIFFQAAGGLMAHLMFAKHKRRNVFGHLHAWLGRAIITLGMINGGLGLQLSADGGRASYIAYGVLAGVIWVAFVGNAVYFELFKKNDAPKHGANTGAVLNRQISGEGTSSEDEHKDPEI